MKLCAEQHLREKQIDPELSRNSRCLLEFIFISRFDRPPFFLEDLLIFNASGETALPGKKNKNNASCPFLVGPQTVEYEFFIFIGMAG